MIQNKNAFLVATEKIDQRVSSDLHDRLKGEFSLSDPQLICRKAVDVAQYIELVGNVLFWAPLSVAATAFLAKLGERAADDIYDEAKKRFKNTDKNPIEKLSGELLRAYDSLGGSISIHLAIQFSDYPYDAATVVIDDYSPIPFATATARLAVIAERLGVILEEHPDNLGRPIIKFPSASQASIEWLDRDFKRHEVIIDILD